MKYEQGSYVLSTGRRLFAHMGVLGLGAFAKTIWEGGSRLVDQNGMTPAEKLEILEEMLGQWLTWGEYKEPKTLAQMAIAFGEHMNRGGTLPTAPNRATQEVPKFVESDTVVVPRATYERLIADAATLAELGGK